MASMAQERVDPPGLLGATRSVRTALRHMITDLSKFVSVDFGSGTTFGKSGDDIWCFTVSGEAGISRLPVAAVGPERSPEFVKRTTRRVVVKNRSDSAHYKNFYTSGSHSGQIH